MNISHESLLITSAPAEILVGLAIFFCVSAALLFALSIEAGTYPALKRRFTLPTERRGGATSRNIPDLNSRTRCAITGGYAYDRAA
jgi:hypothetical protein